MLRTAFNKLTRLHSREAQLRRPGSPDIYSPCRITPSNYTRFIAGPEFTTVPGREFILPVDTLTGEFTEVVSFGTVPTAGTYQLSYNAIDTVDINWDDNAAAVQAALRAVAGLANVTVTGDTTAGFKIVFSGFNAQPLLVIPDNFNTLVDVAVDPVQITVSRGFQVWNKLLKRGDKILTAAGESYTVKEIIDIEDLGGGVMGYRTIVE